MNVNQSCQNLYPLSIQQDMFIQNEGKFNHIQECWYFTNDITILYWQIIFKLGRNYIYIYRCIRTLEWSCTFNCILEKEVLFSEDTVPETNILVAPEKLQDGFLFGMACISGIWPCPPSTKKRLGAIATSSGISSVKTGAARDGKNKSTKVWYKTITPQKSNE